MVKEYKLIYIDYNIINKTSAIVNFYVMLKKYGVFMKTYIENYKLIHFLNKYLSYFRKILAKITKRITYS